MCKYRLWKTAWELHIQIVIFQEGQNQTEPTTTIKKSLLTNLLWYVYVKTRGGSRTPLKEDTHYFRMACNIARCISYLIFMDIPIPPLLTPIFRMPFLVQSPWRRWFKISPRAMGSHSPVCSLQERHSFLSTMLLAFVLQSKTASGLAFPTFIWPWPSHRGVLSTSSLFGLVFWGFFGLVLVFPRSAASKVCSFTLRVLIP